MQRRTRGLLLFAVLAAVSLGLAHAQPAIQPTVDIARFRPRRSPPITSTPTPPPKPTWR